jgi:hypothetical protein
MRPTFIKLLPWLFHQGVTCIHQPPHETSETKTIHSLINLAEHLCLKPLPQNKVILIKVYIFKKVHNITIEFNQKVAKKINISLLLRYFVTISMIFTLPTKVFSPARLLIKCGFNINTNILWTFWAYCKKHKWNQDCQHFTHHVSVQILHFIIKSHFIKLMELATKWQTSLCRHTFMDNAT